MKKGLHFARQSATIVKLIILIPYFTAGGASTMAKCECCGKGVAFGIKVFVKITQLQVHHAQQHDGIVGQSHVFCLLTATKKAGHSTK